MRTATKRWMAGSVLAVALGMGADPLRAEDPDPSERGFQPTGSYQLSDIETVNSKNGNVLLQGAAGRAASRKGRQPGLSVHPQLQQQTVGYLHPRRLEDRFHPRRGPPLPTS